MDDEEIKCPECGLINNFQNKFCGKCGSKLPSFKYCPKCYYTSYNNEFCTKCGEKLASIKDLNLKLDPENLIEEVHNLMDMKQYNKALMYCDIALDNNVDFGRKIDISNIYSLKSDIYVEIGDYNVGLGYCNEAIKIDPNNAAVYDSKAYLLFNMKRYDEAADCCLKSLELCEDFYPYYLLGEISFEKGDYDISIEACEIAKKLNPTYPHLIKLIEKIKNAQK